jgi:protein-disulfide isomerase
MSDEVKVSKDVIYGIVIVGLVAALIAAVFTQGFGLVSAQEQAPDTGTAAGTTTAGSTGEAAQPAQPAQPAGDSGGGGTEVSVSDLVDDDMSMGSDSAPVIMVEFSDFQCSFCRRFYSNTYSQIKTDYVDTDKVKYVFRDFPLSFHPGAQKAAEAVECADEQGKGWELHDKMYDEQNKQGSGTIQFGVTDIKGWASEIGLDSTSFDSCLDSGKYASEVSQDMQDGSDFGVSGTPAFFLIKSDGTGFTQISGARPYSDFKSSIDALLQ